MRVMKPIIELIQTNMRMEQEGAVMRAVANVGVNVDKERLVRAIEDARSFWLEGYNEGVNAGRPHGRWVGIEYDGYADGCPVYDLGECSNCGQEESGEDVPEQNPHCRGCGAKMDEEEEDA